MNMIKNSKNIRGTNLIYSDSALQALYAYTGGVALYGKEICNVIIEDIIANPDKYAKRKVIYASDVAEATQRLIEQQESKLAERSRIREIYEAVTKNLRRDSDMQYLWYIAQWLHTNTHQDGFSVDEFSKKGILRDEKELYDSLEIAVARGILKDSKKDGQIRYVFRTIFYYFAFLGSAENNLDEKRIFLEDNNEQSDEYEQRPDPLQMIDQFGKLSDRDKMTVFSSEYHQKLNSVMREEFRKSIGDHYEGDHVSGTKIERQNNVQINVQKITNTLNGILSTNASPTVILDGLQKLPRLISYFEADELPLLLQDMDSDNSDISLAAEMKIDEKASQMAADYRAALALQDDISESFCVWDVLGIEQDDYYILTEKIDLSFITDLYFAAKLDSIFTLVSTDDKNSEMKDYSPVSIMYCKILEKMLKFYHTDIYRRRVPYISTEVKINGKKVKFGDLDDDNIRALVQNKIMLGAFLFPINPEKITDHHGNWEKLANSSRVAKQEAWKKHGRMLYRAKYIRNSSAHGAEGVLVDRQMLDELKEMLLKDSGLLNIIDLCN